MLTIALLNISQIFPFAGAAGGFLELGTRLAAVVLELDARGFPSERCLTGCRSGRSTRSFSISIMISTSFASDRLLSTCSSLRSNSSAC